MRRLMILAAAGLALAGCESTPRSTSAPGTPGIDTLRADADRCAELGLTPGSAEMIDCIRRAQEARQAAAG